MNRMEKVKIVEVRSQAKIVGTLVALAGALVMTLYKGPLIPLPWSNPDQHNGNTKSSQDHNHWVAGTLLILLACVAWSCFYVLQVRSLFFLFIIFDIYQSTDKLTFWPPSWCICVEYVKFYVPQTQNQDWLMSLTLLLVLSFLRCGILHSIS